MFDRYNRLLDTIHKSLQDLLKALKGLVVMSQELENMANSLYNNMVPSMWASKVGGSAAYKMSQVDHSPPPNRLPVFGVSRKRFRVVAGNSGRFMLLV